MTQNETPSLNECGILHGTDKSSLGHGYLRQYERLFGHLRNEPINILEIGVGGGESIRMWSEYFPRSVVVGIDFHKGCLLHAGQRRIVEIGAIDDVAFLQRLGVLYRPTIVIDNGSHRADHIILAFQHLYPLMQQGGYYVVECLHFHAGGGAAHWRGDAPVAPQDYFLALAQLVACPESKDISDRNLATQTDAVNFFYGCVSIRRKPASDIRNSIDEHRLLVERANHPRMWSNFSQMLLNNGGNPHEAIAACRKAVELDSADPSLRHYLSVALERSGDLEAAIDACCEAIVMNPTFEVFRNRLTALHSKRDT